MSSPPKDAVNRGKLGDMSADEIIMCSLRKWEALLTVGHIKLDY